jgi:hypothetical protein
MMTFQEEVLYPKGLEKTSWKLTPSPLFGVGGEFIFFDKILDYGTL